MSRKDREKQIARIRNLIIGGVALIVVLVAGYGLLYTTGVADGEFVAGRHYQLLEGGERHRPGQSYRVLEFFSYGCVHCRNFDPLIEDWLSRKPEDVRFERVPVAFSPDWRLLAQTYYALEALGIREQLHERIFARIHDRRDFFTSPEEVAEFVDGRGATAAEFLRAFNSQAVRRQVREADQLSRRYGVPSVPTLVVDGRYLITMDVGRKVALEVVDYLLNELRAGRDPGSDTGS